MRELGALSVIALFITACGGLKLASPTQGDVDRMADVYPDYTLAELNHGMTLYQDKCTQCHGMKDPMAYTTEQWERITPGMSNKARSKGIAVSAEEEGLILKYLVTMSSSR